MVKLIKIHPDCLRQNVSRESPLSDLCQQFWVQEFFSVCIGTIDMFCSLFILFCFVLFSYRRASVMLGKESVLVRCKKRCLQNVIMIYGVDTASWMIFFKVSLFRGAQISTPVLADSQVKIGASFVQETVYLKALCRDLEILVSE